MPTRLLAAASETAERELPMPPWAYGVIALAVFASLFALLWAFRSVASKH
jgi:hypothetical protein